MNLDDDLRRALRRQPAPPRFAETVLARIARDDVSRRGEPPSPRSGRSATRPSSAGSAVRSSGPPRRPGLWRRWLAAAAALTLVAGGAARYYIHQRTVAEAERVKAEIRVALQITSEKLALVQRMVQDGPADRLRRGYGVQEAGHYVPVER